MCIDFSSDFNQGSSSKSLELSCFKGNLRLSILWDILKVWRKFNLKILIEFTLIKKSIKRVHFVTGLSYAFTC